MRVGLGYDLHRLVVGRPFVIGGLSIPFDRGPEGHSDGDALTHAVVDALFGALAEGDIGQHFPPGDPSCAGINSLRMLAKAISIVNARGYRVANIDAVIICERPKLSPHYKEIRENIASVLSVDISQVSIKSKTNEGLGEIGAGEAIAAQAVALLEKAD